MLSSWWLLLLSSLGVGVIYGQMHRVNETQVLNAIDFNLKQLETIRFNEVVEKLQAEGYSIRGFYHTSAWRGHWKAIVQEQLQIMDGQRPHYSKLFAKHQQKLRGTVNPMQQGASLLSIADKVIMNVAGSETSKDMDLMRMRETVDGLGLKDRDKITLASLETVDRGAFGSFSPERKEKILAKGPGAVTSGEVATVNQLHAYCKAEKEAGRKALVYYVHSKGGCCPKEGESPVSHWRELMNAFVLEFPSICLRALSEGYSTCGPEYQDAHYSGNFWWANCDHVGSLDPLTNMFDAYAAEFFVFRVHSGNDPKYAMNCGYNPWHCRVNHYDFQCPRQRYLPRIMESIQYPTLPPNPTTDVEDKSFAWVKEHCPKMRATPFKEQQQKNWW